MKGRKTAEAPCHCCSCHVFVLRGYHAGWCHAAPHDKGVTKHCYCPTCQERAEESIYELLWQKFDAFIDEWLDQHCNKTTLWNHDLEFQHCPGCGSFVISEFSMVEVLPIWLTGENQ